MLLLVSCATKNNGFIGANDYNHPKLPPKSVKQQPTYYVPPPTAAESSIVFVPRPRPNPVLIADAPDNYEGVKINNLKEYTQTLSLGYNSKNEVSLLITPYQENLDSSKIQKVFTELGLKRTASNLKGTPEQYVVANINNINVYSYHNSLMLSIVQDTNDRKKKTSSKRSRKNNPEKLDHTANFNFLNNLRELLVNI